jgi:hypothetical protein
MRHSSTEHTQQATIKWPTTAMLVSLCTQSPAMPLVASYNDIRFNKEASHS